MKAQQVEMQKLERSLYIETKVKLLTMLEDKLSEVRSDANRSPASDSATQIWIKNSIKLLEGRIQKVKLRSI